MNFIHVRFKRNKFVAVHGFVLKDLSFFKLKDVMPTSAGFDPVTRRMMTRIQRPIMDVIHVHRRVLAVHLFGDNNFATNQTVEGQDPTIIVLKPWAERQMWCARIFFCK